MTESNDDQILYTADLSGDLVLDEEGNWHHDQTPFSNLKLASLFHRSIVWNEQKQRYVIRLAKGEADFTIEDVPFFVADLEPLQSGIQVTLLSGTQYQLQPETLQIGSKNQIYCQIKGGHLARFRRSAHQQLACYVSGDREIQIAGISYTLRQIDR